MAAKTTKKTTTSVRPAKKKITLVEETSLNPQEFSKSNSLITKKRIVIIAVIAAIVFLLYSFKGFFIAATVNGQVISRLSVIKELESQGGKRILENIVTQALIQQEAKKKNITINQSDIDQEIASTESQLATQGQNLEQWLAFQGMTQETFRDQVRLQKIVEELLGKDIAVTDVEIADFIEKNSDTLTERVGSDSAKITSMVKEQLKRQKLNEKVQPWLAELQKNAKVNYFVNY